MDLAFLTGPLLLCTCAQVLGNNMPAPVIISEMPSESVQSKYWVFTYNNVVCEDLSLLDYFKRDEAQTADSDINVFMQRMLDMGSDERGIACTGMPLLWLELVHVSTTGRPILKTDTVQGDLPHGIKGLLLGFEISESGTRHIQGYVEFHGRKRLRQVRTLFPGCHMEPRRGRAEQAVSYCIKTGSWSLLGRLEIKKPGQRSDLEALKEDLLRKKSIKDISDDHFACFLKYDRAISKFRSIHSERRFWVPEVFVYWGPTGTGKTSKVWNDNPPADIWAYSAESGCWFDGYDGQSIVLFDEFHGGIFRLPYLLKLLDAFPMQVPVKGGFVNWVPKKIFITSNIDPVSWFPNANSEHVRALMRRVTNIIHFASINSSLT